MGELEAFFKGVWSIFEMLDMNFDRAAYNLEKMQRFVVGINSQLYPQIGLLYRRRIQAWATSDEPA
jgi:hypothetical protein